jgi:hypothetical protein
MKAWDYIGRLHRFQLKNRFRHKKTDGFVRASRWVTSVEDGSTRYCYHRIPSLVVTQWPDRRPGQARCGADDEKRYLFAFANS